MKTNDQSLKPIGKPATLALDSLIPSGSNREVKKDADLKGLATSIAEVGLIYPIIVKPDAEQDGLFRIIAGERRWRALKLLKLESAPCVVISAKEDDGKAEVMSVVENHQRKNLEPLEEAAAVRALLDNGLEPEAVARSLGRSRAWVARRASLMDLSEEWVKEVKNAESKISTWPPSHLEIVSRFPIEVQNQMLERWGHSWRREVPIIRDLEQMTGEFLRQLSSAIWKLDDEMLCPEAGACSACPKRSSHVPDLFEDELPGSGGQPVTGDLCLDPACWKNKAMVFLKRKHEELRQDHPDLILLNNGNHADPEQIRGSFNSDVVQSWEAVGCKKTDKGAKPALVVNGAGYGRIKWIKLNRDEFPPKTASSRKAHTQADEPPVQRTPEMKKEPYDKRRRQVVIDAVKSKLEAIGGESDLDKVPGIEGGQALVGEGFLMKTLCLLSALLSDRGWNRRILESDFRLPEDLPWESLGGDSIPTNGEGFLSPEKHAALRAVCWSLLRMATHIWASRLAVVIGDRNNDLQYAEAERICSMLGFDLPALRAQAAAAVPYAKAWGNDVTDDWVAQKQPEKTAQVESETQPTESGGDTTPAEEPPPGETLRAKRLRRRAKKQAERHARAAR